MAVVDYDSPAVQSYLQILQGVINRMAANSAASKTWSIALVSAILVIVADKGNADYAWIALIPIALFLFLDSYYLGLEKRFRDHYNAFIKKVHDRSAIVDDLYIVTPGRGFRVFARSILKSLISLSVWPFYGLLAAMLVIVRYVLLPAVGDTG